MSENNSVMKIAITGGIGSGKSYFCDLLRKRGFEVYDCDNAAKRIMRENPDVIRRLKELVGDDAYTADGKLNKPLLASFILSSEENAKCVNGIVHPAVAADFEQSGMTIMECAILFKSHFDRLVDRVVCISADLEVRVQRVMSRDSISRDKAMEWISCQMSQEEMERRSDVVIGHNTEVTEEDMQKLIEVIKA